MSRFSSKVKFAFGVAGALLAGSQVSAQEYFETYEPQTTYGQYEVIGDVVEGDGAEVEEGPWKLFKTDRIDIGGWFQFGYTTEDNGLFNTRPDSLNLHQGWFFAEKVAEAKDGRLGWGFRFDGLYGIDGPDTQSFGNSGGTFDAAAAFDRGAQFGWAIPQLYGEVAGEDWSVKVGHFYTLIGYEVVQAPDNFFFSHAITQFNSEPFTHTGAIGTFELSDRTTGYAGWTLGWDTGFDQFGGGSNFLGGFSTAVNDKVTATYINTIGDFGARGSDAYSHSIVVDTAVTDRFNYVFQSDLLRVESTGEDNIGINQYFLYDINDRLAAGLRAEWWKADGVTDFTPFGSTFPVGAGSASYYDVTVGLNIKPSQNWVFRPEYRYDWSPALGFEQGQFGIDMIILY